MWLHLGTIIPSFLDSFPSPLRGHALPSTAPPLRGLRQPQGCVGPPHFNLQQASSPELRSLSFLFSKTKFGFPLNPLSTGWPRGLDLIMKFKLNSYEIRRGLVKQCASRENMSFLVKTQALRQARGCRLIGVPGFLPLG